MRMTATGNCRVIKNNFIFISDGSHCLAYPLDLIKEIKCNMYGHSQLDLTLPFEKIFINKRIKIILRGEKIGKESR